MSLPSRDEILGEAVKIFMSENPEAPVPEEDELREGNYWVRARDGLMRGVEGELESALGMYEEEVRELRDALGIAPPLEFAEMEEKLEDTTARLERTMERLRAARAEIKRYEEEEERRRERPPKAPPPVAMPPPAEMGLQPEDEKKFRDIFLTKLMEGTFGHSAARGHLPEFRILLGEVREAWKDVPRMRAVDEARSDVEVLVDKIIARKPPRVAPPPYLRRAPPAVIRIELPEERPREPTYETRYCWIGDESFTHDVDLEMRLRKPVMRGRFAASVPALDLPERFYHLCSEHKMEEYSYFSMIDAVAYRLADRGKQNIGFTVSTLRGLGLTPTDISTIVLRAGDYGYKHQSSSSSSSYAVP